MNLKAKVEAVNLANQYANELCPKLVEVCKPFVGKKVVTQTGELVAKLWKDIDEMGLPHTSRISVYRTSSNYSLTFVVKTCFSDNGVCEYHESPVYVGNIDKGILTLVRDDSPNYRTDYNAEQVELRRKEYRIARDAAGEALSQLYPFGE